MSTTTTFSQSEIALMVCVLKQIGGLKAGKVNYEQVRQDLNLPSKAAAKVRWCNLNKKLKADKANSTAELDTGGELKQKAVITPKKREGRGKKRKIDYKDEEDKMDHENVNKEADYWGV